VIVNKPSDPYLYFQIHKFISGNPPDNFEVPTTGAIENSLNTQHTVNIFDIDYLYLLESTPILYIVVLTPHSIYLGKYDITNDFLKYSQD
jgi:hypothetical protein